MPTITAENRDAWQGLANSVEKEKPSVGRIVRIIDGRKHKGKVGKVTKHQQNKFYDAFRYGSEASHMLTQLRGRNGYIVLVKTETEQFWVKAEYTMVCYE